MISARRGHISSNTLKRTSGALAAKVLSDLALNEYQVGLRLKAEDMKPTEIMFYWVCTGKLPDPGEWEQDSNRHAEIWIRVWLTGNRFKLAQFMDEIMLRLLKWCRGFNLSVEVAQVAYQKSKAGSAMRKLVVEEVAWMLENNENVRWKDLTLLTKIKGFTDELTEALQLQDMGISTTDCSSKGEDVVQAPWKKFMVGGGPSQHWVFDKET